MTTIVRRDWHDFEKACCFLAKHLEGKGCKNIYALPRGGLPIAVRLSHAMDLPLILKEEEITLDTLVVDDISDTGSQLVGLVKRLRFSPAVACWFTSDWTEYEPDVSYETKLDEEDWIMFPWEGEWWL